MKKNTHITINGNAARFWHPRMLYSGASSEQYALKYIEELANVDIPGNSCITHIKAKYNKNTSIEISNWHPNYSEKHKKSVHDVSLDIDFHIEPKKCSFDEYGRSCLENIQSGKCSDECMKRLFGLKFFAEKYKQQNNGR